MSWLGHEAAKLVLVGPGRNCLKNHAIEVLNLYELTTADEAGFE